MEYHYKTHGTCSRAIDFEIIDEKLHNVRYTGGCNGNLKAIGKLLEGKNAAEVANMLRGNTCGHKPTSCADQLAKAIDRITQHRTPGSAGPGCDREEGEVCSCAERVLLGTTLKSCK